MLKNLDQKQKIELTITVIGVMFLVFLLIGNMQKKEKEKTSLMKSGESIASSLSAPISIDMEQTKESAVKDDWGRDPFSNPVSGSDVSGMDGFILNGIVWDKDNPYAIINSEVVKPGDKIDSVTVIEITDSSVVLERDGERYTLRLNTF